MAHIDISGGCKIFLIDEGVLTPDFGQVLAENCMKMKEIGPTDQRRGVQCMLDGMNKSNIVPVTTFGEYTSSHASLWLSLSIQ